MQIVVVGDKTSVGGKQKFARTFFHLPQIDITLEPGAARP